MMKQTFILFLAVGVAYCAILPELTKSEQHLSNILLKSGRSLSSGSTRNGNCFAIYLPLINAQATEFEKRHNACVATYDEKTSRVENEMTAARDAMMVSTGEMCNSYSQCHENPSNRNFFECYQTVASTATQSSFEIEKDSGAKKIYMDKELLNFVYEKDQCTDEASRTYLEESSRTYADLEKCLDS